MNVVIGDTRQLSPNVASMYITEACGTRSYAGNNPLPCYKTNNITDQFIENTYCGVFALDVKRCAKPDPLLCDIGFSSKDEDPLTSVTWRNEAPDLRCFYDSTKIDTIKQLQNYKLIFGETDDYRRLVTKFCLTGTSDKCSAPNTRCTKLRSLDDDGSFCRTFYNKQSIEAQESMGQNACFTHPETPECACYRRANDPVYKKLAMAAPFKDSCWYVPCRDSFSNLIPADLRNPTCPSNVCQFIIDTADNNNVNISDIKSSIDCQFGPTPPTPPGPKPPTPPGPKPPIPPAPEPQKPFRFSSPIAIAAGVSALVYVATGGGKKKRR